MKKKIGKKLRSVSKYILAASIILLVGCHHSPKDEFILEGNISAYEADFLILAYQDSVGESVLDTVRVKDGKLSYRKRIQQAVVATLVPRDSRNSVTFNGSCIAPDFITLFIEPGTKLELRIDNHRWPQIHMKGGTLNNDLMLLYEKVLPLRYEAFEILRKFCGTELSEEEQTVMGQQRKALKDKDIEEQKKFVTTHPCSFAALYLLGNIRNNMSFEAYTAAFYKFDSGVRNTPLGQKMEAEIQRAQKTLVGGLAPDFEKTDKNGKIIRLSDYEGKYVLLDFWGSWCGPCRASHPHLQELENKYKDQGLVIINIAREQGNSPRTLWLKAIEEDRLTGIQILNNEDQRKCDVVKTYSITAFPTKILIDPQRKILVREKGSCKLIDEKLREVFQR